MTILFADLKGSMELLADRDPEEARKLLDPVLEWMHPFVAHCHLGLGTLYGRTGDGAKAQEHLTAATEMYREMDMRFWLAKSETTQQG